MTKYVVIGRSLFYSVFFVVGWLVGWLVGGWWWCVCSWNGVVRARGAVVCVCVCVFVVLCCACKGCACGEFISMGEYDGLVACFVGLGHSCFIVWKGEKVNCTYHLAQNDYSFDALQVDCFRINITL